MLSVIIPFYNGHKTIGKLLKTIPAHLPVLIMNDWSDKGFTQADVTRPNTTVMQMKRKGFFTGAVNEAIRHTNPDSDILILNQDTHFTNNEWLALLEEKRSNYAIIGERIKGQHPSFPHGYIHGTFLFVRRDALNKVGLMDAKSYPLWGSTADWQLRFCRAGYNALPLDPVPGFIHERGDRPYGSSIESMIREHPYLKNLLVRTPPTVSVVIACKNYGRFLPDALASLVGGQTSMGEHPGQTFQGFEVVVVDYGSTDNTQEILKPYLNGWLGIRAIKTKDNGTAAACNAGVKEAHGKYIAMLDADDMMLPHRLELMLNKAEANPGRVICDSLLPFNEEGLVRYEEMGKRFTWKMPEFDYQALLQKNNMHKGIMYPKVAWQAAGGYPEIMTDGREDWAFNVALGRVGYCGLNVHKAGYLYRRQAHNRTLTNGGQRHYFLSKIQGLFPDVYAGGAPMCCGKDQQKTFKTNSMTASRSASQLLAGREGFTRIEYIGKNVGDADYWGKVTGTRYRFGGKKRYGLVDNRDVPELIGRHKNGTLLFRAYVPPVEVVKAQAEAEAIKTEEGVPEVDAPISAETMTLFADEPTPDQVPAVETIDPTSATAAQIQTWLDSNPDKVQVQLVHDAEVQGKNRKTVVAMLVAYLEA